MTRSAAITARRTLGWTLLALGACAAPQSPRTDPDVPLDRPPVAGTVRDGIGPDVDASPNTSSLFANWDPFPDPEGRPVLYEWSIGTHAGATDVMPWRAVGGSTQAAVTGDDIALPRDQMLFVSVRAADLSGNVSDTASSDGIVLGTAVTTPGAVATNTQVAAMDGGRRTLDRFGITWTFARPVTAGRFANGDWWVEGPVDITAITPPCTTIDGRTRNGAMLDPDPRSPRQGYDSAMYGGDQAFGYDAQLNVAAGVSDAAPLHIAAGHSLIATISAQQAGAMPQLETCAVLTVLAEPPPEDAFRPPYCGSDKSCRHRAGELDLLWLARLPAVAGAPQPAELAELFERTWLDHTPGWQGRYLHPAANMPDYGREMAAHVGTAGLLLQLDLPDAAKRNLALRLVQYGLDVHGIVAAGGRFVADGGSGAGRKFPLLLAAVLLHDDALLRTLKDHPDAFAEDVQTFFVTETAAGEINGGHGGYDARDVGLAEWGVRHGDDPRTDQKPWTADPYRRCCTANVWCGFVLATRILGVRAEWGHDALFEYVDRYMQVEPRGSWTRAWTPFVERMWDRYRTDF